MSNPLTGSRGPMIVRSISGGFGTVPIGQLNFVATINLAEPAALNDNELSMLSIDTVGRLRVGLPTGGTPVFPADFGDSLYTAGQAAAPGAGGAVATLAAPAAGDYHVYVIIGYGAAAGATNDMELRRAGAAFATPLLVQGVANPTLYMQGPFRITLNGAQNLTINAIVGAAGDYKGSIHAVRVQ